MSNDKMREDFEAWYPSGCGVAGVAAKLAAKQAWKAAWQASRAAIEIELPQRWYDGHGMMREEPDGIWIYHDETVSAIESAGLMVKK